MLIGGAAGGGRTAPPPEATENPGLGISLRRGRHGKRSCVHDFTGVTGLRDSCDRLAKPRIDANAIGPLAMRAGCYGIMAR